MHRTLFLFLLMTLMTISSVAQDDSCSLLVREALERTTEVCSETGRNEACYGNISIEAEAQPDTENFTFEQSGDIVSIADLSRMTLAEMQGDDTWGVALLRIQANLPDTLPGQNVTMLLFGDVSLDTNVESPDMAGFYVSSGISEPRCTDAPEDGILIQTPAGLEDDVALRINGAELMIGSTVFIQAQPGGDMAVMMLEGEVRVTAQDRTMSVPAGAWIQMPMDAAGNVTGEPVMRAYEMDSVSNLPVQMMPDAIDIAPPMTEENITSWLSKPLAGQWTSTLLEGCDDTGASQAFYTVSNVDASGFDLQPDGGTILHYIVREPGVYINEFGAEWTVTAPDTVQSRVVYEDGCVSLTELTLQQ